MYENLDPQFGKTSDKKKLFIGSDESLKGDTFGGLVVAGVCVDEELQKKFNSAGITDSKKIPIPKIKMLADYVKQHCLAFCVKNIYPDEYNTYDSKGLLNKYHQEVYDEIIKQLKEKKILFDDMKIIHIVDQYPGAIVGDIIETKADSTYVEVAAGSILAREAALDQIKELSKKIGFTLPLGSTHVKEALQRMKAEGHDPHSYVKLHFKNVQAALRL